MNWIGNAIVTMWFIPVTLFIIIPLVLLAGHILGNIVFRMKEALTRSMEQGKTVGPGEMYG